MRAAVPTDSTDPTDRPSPRRPGALVAAVALAAALVLAGCSGGGGQAGGDATPLALPDLVRRTEPAVVTVQTPSGLGSGVAYRGDVVVTNQHVVTNTPVVALQFADGTSAPGQVLASDAVSDIAVIRSARAGVRAGDVVTSFAGQPVASAQDVVTRVARTEPGRQVPLTVVRGGATVPLDLTVGDRPG